MQRGEKGATHRAEIYASRDPRATRANPCQN
jgi:hypothetical protein